LGYLYEYENLWAKMLDKNEFMSCVGEEEGIGSVGEDDGRNIILIILVLCLRGRPIQQLGWNV